MIQLTFRVLLSRYLPIIVLFCGLISCQQTAIEHDKNTLSDKEISSSAFIININGDTISTGIPIAVKKMNTALDTMPPPKQVRSKSPTPIDANAHVFPNNIIEIETITVNEHTIRTIIPGEGNTKIPQIIKAQEVVRPALFQPLKAVSDLRFKDLGSHDIRYMDVAQGLASPLLSSIYRDKDDYLWLGHQGDGLCRYDGQYMRCFTTKEGLIDNMVYDIIADQNHHLWIATEHGLSKYDGTHFHNYSFPELPQNRVNRIYEDRAGKLWLATQLYGILQFDPTTGIAVHYGEAQGISLTASRSIIQDEEGNIWFGGRKGLYRFDGSSFQHFTSKNGLIHDIVLSIYSDGDNGIWVGTTNGICRYDGRSFYHYRIPITNPYPYAFHIFKDDQQNIWFGTRRQGVLRYDGTSFFQYAEQEGLDANEISELIADTHQNIWIVTYGNGMYRLDYNSFKFFDKKSGLHHHHVDHFIEDHLQNVWLSAGTAIKFQDNSFHKYHSDEGLSLENGYCLAEDEEKNIWIGGHRNGAALVRFDGVDFTYYSRAQGLTHGVYDIIGTADSSVWWCGPIGGFSRMKDGIITQYDPEGEVLNFLITDLFESKEGHIWIATDNGLIRFDGDNFIVYTTQEGLSSNFINHITESSDGILWVGTDNGLNRFNGTYFDHIYNCSPNFRNGVQAIAEDHEGNLWLTTPKELILIRSGEVRADIGCSTKIFKEGDGLKTIKFREKAIYISSDHVLWLGTIGGVLRLDIDEHIAKNEVSQPLTVQLNSIQMNGNFVSFFEDLDKSFGNRTVTDSLLVPFQNYPQRLDLLYHINHLTFQYISIDWQNPNRINYQVQLEGLESDWSQPTYDTKIDYRNLSHGDYIFKIRARNGTAEWGETFAYAFTIRPPFWLSTAAYIFYFLLFCAILYGSFLIVQRRLRLQNAYEQEQLEAQRLKELDTFKTRLYTNLTHEFRTPLTVILGMVDQMREAPKKYFDEGTRLIERNGNNLLQLINQLLDLSKLENKSFQLQYQQSDIIAYLRYLTQSFHSYANAQNLSLNFYSSEEELIMDFDAEQIKQIMTNLISNAVKYTPSSGAIDVKIKRNEDRLLWQIQDTGVGIEKSDLTNIFDRFYQVDDSSTRKAEGTGIGLAHTQELVKLMEGEIRVESKINEGTTFFIEIPIRQMADKEVMKNQTIDVVVPMVSDPSNMTHQSSSIIDENKPQLLIIEDNPDVVTYLRACLADQYQIDIAYNGKIGIEKAIEMIPDLIISDVMMPEKNGYEVCDALKNDERTSHIPITLLTAKADSVSKIKGLKRGADAYLSKPFNKEELLVRLEMMLERQRKLAAYFSQQVNSTELQKGTVPIQETAIIIEDAFLKKVTKILEKNYQKEEFGLPQLCKKVGMSRSQLFRKLKALIQQSPSQLIRQYRLKKAKELLEAGELNVNEVTWAVGLSNPTHFSKIFKEEFGVTPRELLKFK
ncbi:MAG: two-component regulator propeller domain-containing protein [Bacteroidota bacterium]